MRIDSTLLAAELARLRKGRAMRDPDLCARLGPQTRAAFGIEDGDGPPVVRRRTRARIERLLRDAELRTALLVALALHHGADQRLLKDREAYLAELRNFEPRTARRRMDLALRELVAAIAEEEHGRVMPDTRCDADGFVVRTLRARMRLDTPSPRLHERRLIVVTADRLEEITVRMTVPRPDPGAAAGDLRVSVELGGVIVRAQRSSPEDFEFTLRLSRGLRLGDTYEYGLVFDIPAGQRMRPYYVFQPLVPCERFELEVCFDTARPPGGVWLIDGVVPRALDHAPEQPGRLAPDARGAVRQTFANLRQGMAYGVRWAPPAGP
ncbi:hypothetical protein [Catellatospora sp. NPDC049609]|uniref:hypothetical protein n=1 Tax=Catellatospora sp. NPDC049609 TaxID=3155505 RepID=UPI0034215129